MPIDIGVSSHSAAHPGTVRVLPATIPHWLQVVTIGA
jgi:hypothetical protein